MVIVMYLYILPLYIVECRVERCATVEYVTIRYRLVPYGIVQSSSVNKKTQLIMKQSLFICGGSLSTINLIQGRPFAQTFALPTVTITV